MQTSFAFVCNSTAATPTKANQSGGGQLILRFGLYLVSRISWLLAEDWGEGYVSTSKEDPWKISGGCSKPRTQTISLPPFSQICRDKTGRHQGKTEHLTQGLRDTSVLQDPISNRRILKGTLVGGLASLGGEDHTVRIFITSQRLCQQHLC